MARLPTFELQNGEHVQHEETAMYLKSKIQAWGGKLVLTDRRLVFLKHKASVWASSFGLIGALFSKPKSAGMLFEIGLNDIASYARSKHGVNKNVLAVGTGAHPELRFVLDSTYEEWVALLQTAAPSLAATPASMPLVAPL